MNIMDKNTKSIQPKEKKELTNEEGTSLEQLFEWGLYIEGDHHRLWCLHQIAQVLVDQKMLPADILEDDMDKGIAP